MPRRGRKNGKRTEIKGVGSVNCEQKKLWFLCVSKSRNLGPDHLS